MDTEDEVFIGCGNVFADLGLPDAEELQLKGRLGIEIRRAIQGKRLNYKQAAAKMGIERAQLLHLLDSNSFEYSVDQLIHYLRRLGRDVEITVAVRERR
jgi:predicted XRE-type DNA-binding protein